jgi:DNA replication and repair protein RecF
MLATGKSFRADSDTEVIRYEEKFSIFNFQFSSNSEIFNGRITMADGPTSLKLRGVKKKFEVNGVARRMMDFVGRFKAVLFGPQDMELVTGSPSGRRRYLDFVISQMDREYRRNLISYEKGLRQRNKLLEKIRDGGATRTQLFFWDRLLIKNGEYITRKREEYLDMLNTPHQLPPSLGGREKGGYRVVYDKSVISEVRLKQYEVEEVLAAVTLVGPHRDDFLVERQLRDVTKYGSRGEQRMAVLWLKDGELDYLTNDRELPVLLLDDIFSELDHQHREVVVKMVGDQVKKGGQVIITTADEHMMPVGKGWKVIRL